MRKMFLSLTISCVAFLAYGQTKEQKMNTKKAQVIWDK